MGKRLAVLSGLAVVMVVAQALVPGQAGAASTITHNYSYTDPRSDLPSRAGEVDRAVYGPYSVPANGELQNNLATIDAPCTNCRITDMVPNLVYADGTTANMETDAMLHHFVAFNPGATDLTCGSTGVGVLGERFFASGNERTHNHLPDNFGYTNASQNWTLLVDLMNMAAAPQTFYIEIIFRHRPLSGTQTARPMWLDIANCGTSEYTAPTGYSDVHSNWTSTVDGSLIGIGGHQHDLDHMDSGCTTHCPEMGGGVAVSAEVQGGPSSDYYGPEPPSQSPPADLTGATACRSEDFFGTDYGMATGFMGHLDTMSLCGVFDDLPAAAQPEAYPSGGAYPAKGYPLRKGQTIRLHSEYQNDTGAQATGVMGIMQGWLAPFDAYPRPKGATPVHASLVPAFQQCTAGAANRTHGPPLANPSCNPPAQASGFLTVGTPDANGQAPNAAGSVRWVVLVGNPGTPADEADVSINVSMLDVRKKSDLSDYTGELQVSQTLRVTDRNNGPGETGTVSDVGFAVGVPCVATASTSVGSTCSVNTSADAVMPSSVVEGDRAIWQSGQVRVFDGGSDGVASTTGNTLFAVQGVFVP